MGKIRIGMIGCGVVGQGVLRLHVDRSLSAYLWSWLQATDGASSGQDTQNQR